MLMPAGVPVRPAEAVALVDRDLPHVDMELQALGAVGSVATVSSVDEVAPLLLSRTVDVLFTRRTVKGAGAGFVLSVDRNTSTEDFSTWRFPRLVVAPSCFSARRSFETWPPSLVSVALLGGAKWFVGGLWSIPQRRPRPLPAPSYRIWRREGSSYGLRLALIEVRRRYPDVVSWAGIVLFGWPSKA